MTRFSYIFVISIVIESSFFFLVRLFFRFQVIKTIHNKLKLEICILTGTVSMITFSVVTICCLKKKKKKGNKLFYFGKII